MNQYRIIEPKDSENLEWDVIDKLCNAVSKSPNQELEIISCANKGQRAIYMCTFYEREVNNGGYWQFFYNSMGNFWEEVLEGLKTLGASDHEKNFHSVLSLFTQGKPSKNRKERQKQLGMIQKKYFDKFNEVFFKLESQKSWEIIFLSYIKEHKMEFFVK